MKALAFLLLVVVGCEHDPRFEKKHVEDKRPAPVAVQPTELPPVVDATVQRSVAPPMRPIRKPATTKPVRHHRHH